jgi:hypothetical protein
MLVESRSRRKRWWSANPPDEVRSVIIRACSQFNLPVQYVLGPCKEHACVDCRTAIAKQLYWQMGWSFSAISRFLNRDVTTVKYWLGMIGRKPRNNEPYSRPVGLMPSAGEENPVDEWI